MRKKYYIGCSGYYYSYWKNRFYPKGLAPKNWLHYYSSVFNTVELNGTFYRTPKLFALKRYAEATPKDFKFSVKMSKYITHLTKLKDSKQNIKEFQELLQEGLGEKLNHYLFQLPPSYNYTEENLEKIITNIPHAPENVVELRHISWWNKEVERIFKKAKFTFCNVDFPGLKTYFIHTSDRFYLRLHGNPELFKSSYSDAELKKFKKEFPKGCKEQSIYFNNTYYEAGYQNAQTLQKLIKK
jgi:uncharacterized protein YecE (DUF72 family)